MNPTTSHVSLFSHLSVGVSKRLRFQGKLLAGLVAGLGLASCGGKQASSGGNGGPAGPPSCLVKYAESLADIFPKDRLDAVVDTGGAEPKQSVQDVSSLKSVSWSWPGERIRKIEIAGQVMELPKENQIGVSGFRVLDRQQHGPKDGKSYVEQNYRSISAEEMQAIQERMQEQIEERVKRGEITAEQAKLAGGLGEGLAGKERVVETIEGLGDACRWTASDNTLAVGHRNVFFSIHADVTEDKAVNREKAVELARLILAECD